MAIMAAHVGLDPAEDIEWVDAVRTATPWSCSPSGKVDAFLGFPPEPQELRARKIGRVILNTATDKPWSHYFCCVLFGNRDFVRAHPVATKRVPAGHPQGHRPLRRPSRSGPRSSLVDAGFTPRYDYALQTLTETPVRPLARVRRRGHAALLRAAPARGRHDQVEPERASSPRAPTGASSTSSSAS